MTGELRDLLDRVMTIARTKTKLIAPVLYCRHFAKAHRDRGHRIHGTGNARMYQCEVCLTVRDVLGHNLHVGGRYEDAYSSRTLPKYGVVALSRSRTYALSSDYQKQATEVLEYILAALPQYVGKKLGGVIRLQSAAERLEISGDPIGFARILDSEMQRSAAHFEIVSFAVLKVHLEKFACKVYRGSRTSAHDSGIDIATDYGAVYQIKKMHLRTMDDVQEIYSELLTNFDVGRLDDRKVVLIIDDASTTCRQFLLDMHVQALVRKDILTLSSLILDAEDRQKVLRIICEEFERDTGATSASSAG